MWCSFSVQAWLSHSLPDISNQSAVRFHPMVSIIFKIRRSHTQSTLSLSVEGRSFFWILDSPATRWSIEPVCWMFWLSFTWKGILSWTSKGSPNNIHISWNHYMCKDSLLIGELRCQKKLKRERSVLTCSESKVWQCPICYGISIVNFFACENWKVRLVRIKDLKFKWSSIYYWIAGTTHREKGGRCKWILWVQYNYNI